MLRLVGVMLLCQYEHLNCMVRAWSGHLNGVEKFLTLFDDGALYVPRPGYKPPTCPEVRAVFWQFVVQDLEESCKSSGDPPEQHILNRKQLSRITGLGSIRRTGNSGAIWG